MTPIGRHTQVAGHSRPEKGPCRLRWMSRFCDALAGTGDDITGEVGQVVGTSVVSHRAISSPGPTRSRAEARPDSVGSRGELDSRGGKR